MDFGLTALQPLQRVEDPAEVSSLGSLQNVYKFCGPFHSTSQSKVKTS